MTAEEIVAIASELDCGPSDIAVVFARTIAEHCAQLAEDGGPTATGEQVAAIIRTAFRIPAEPRDATASGARAAGHADDEESAPDR